MIATTSRQTDNRTNPTSFQRLRHFWGVGDSFREIVLESTAATIGFGETSCFVFSHKPKFPALHKRLLGGRL
jgi:hypothetical protein